MFASIQNFFSYHWQRKLLAVFMATLIWIFVHESILSTKIISDVPIRIINIPQDKIVLGTLPSGYLNQRISLVIKGTKNVIEELEPGDVEVELDASAHSEGEWPVQISKYNLVSFNPSIDLIKNIQTVSHPDFLLKISPMETLSIPISIPPPLGELAENMEYLEIWPPELEQVLTGPKDELRKLKKKGLLLQFDLSHISETEFENLAPAPGSAILDEVVFIIPEKWKRVDIPYRETTESINDPNAKDLRIVFLRKKLLPIKHKIPIQISFSLATSSKWNPANLSLTPGPFVTKSPEGIYYLTTHLLAREVSSSFLNLISDHLMMSIMPSQEIETHLPWTISVIGREDLENQYVKEHMKPYLEHTTLSPALLQSKEEMFRKRFRSYLQRITFYISPEKKFDPLINIENNHIIIGQLCAS